MPTTLATQAVERSTYLIVASFTDHSEAEVTPNAGLKWTLTNGRGLVVNGRADVALAPPAASVNILLSGDDLALPDEHDTRRVVTIEGTYNSALGSNLPLKDEIVFTIAALARIT